MEEKSEGCGEQGVTATGWYFNASGDSEVFWTGPYESRNAALSQCISSFKRLLLSMCQQQFMSAINDERSLGTEDREADTADKISLEAGSITPEEFKLRQGGLSNRGRVSLVYQCRHACGALLLPLWSAVASPNAGCSLVAACSCRVRHPETRVEKRRKAKRRVLSIISFIGELFKGNLLTASIMHSCIIELLDPGNIDNPDEEKIELLCKLLMSIGKKLDTKACGERACVPSRSYVPGCFPHGGAVVICGFRCRGDPGFH